MYLIRARSKNGVPRGSVLGSILFSISINNLGRDLKQTKVHLYAHDNILYTSATSVKEAITYLKSFSQRKIFLVRLKLLLNATKTKSMFFTRSHSPINVTLSTQGGTTIDHPTNTYYLEFGWTINCLLGSILRASQKNLDPS